MRWIVLGIFLVFFFSSPSFASEAQIKLQGEDGAKVKIKRAELLLSSWGKTGRLPLKYSGATVTVPLVEPVVRAQVADYVVPIYSAFLYVEADGYAPIMSEEFRLIPGEAVNKPSVAINFPRKQSIVVEPNGASKTILKLRRPVKRYLKLTEEDGRPAKGVKVSVGAFWSDSNHCGHLVGVEPFGSGVSGKDGRIKIVDADVKYVLEIDWQQRNVVWSAKKSDFYQERLVVEDAGKEIAVRVHRRKAVDLVMKVSKDKRPAPEVNINVCIADCPCGACCRGLGVTDKDGLFMHKGYMPEVDEKIFITDEEKTVWETDPRKLESYTLDVELGE